MDSNKPRRVSIEREGKTVAVFMYKPNVLFRLYSEGLYRVWKGIKTDEEYEAVGIEELKADLPKFLITAGRPIADFLTHFDKIIPQTIETVYEQAFINAKRFSAQNFAKEKGYVVPGLSASQRDAMASEVLEALTNGLETKGRGRRRKLHDGDIRRALSSLGVSASQPQVAKWLDAKTDDVVNWRRRKGFGTWKEAKTAMLEV